MHLITAFSERRRVAARELDLKEQHQLDGRPTTDERTFTSGDSRAASLRQQDQILLIPSITLRPIAIAEKTTTMAIKTRTVRIRFARIAA